MRIDKKEIRKKGNGFLTDYRTIYRMSPRSTSPKLTKDFFLEVKGSETISKNSYEYECYFKDFVEAFNKLELDERILIYDKYIHFEKKDNITLYCKHNMSESTFYRQLSIAIIHFSEAYKQGVLLKITR
ncbi:MULTISPECIES: ArpU family phage packaging/lysis transcriptional regulator [Vagococcus]|uniref:ArpU family phage packaging/lysis transcriptional regulator n=1 Tax=Vagococcus TaxID=2737 RepID=UPI0015C630FA|nr:MULTISPECIES: ArpU family phage packaging/lysis transcriptional regulator [Vagococcus]